MPLAGTRRKASLLARLEDRLQGRLNVSEVSHKLLRKAPRVPKPSRTSASKDTQRKVLAVEPLSSSLQNMGKADSSVTKLTNVLYLKDNG